MIPKFYTHVLLTLLFSIVAGNLLHAQKTTLDIHPFVGLEYQMSYNYNWGADRPVVISVTPGSPAHRAGIREGDIIESVNGQNATYLPEIDFIRTLETITPQGIELQVSNFGYNKRSVQLFPEYPSPHWTEEKLARAFSMYSLEDQSEIKITYPLDTGKEWKSKFYGKETFAFVYGSDQNERDLALRKTIRNILEKKGLTYSEENPDLIIDFYYSVANNPKYDKKVADKSVQMSLRYTPYTGDVTPYPFLPLDGDPQAYKQELTLGVRLHDMTQEGKLVWSCEASEFLTDSFSLDLYGELTLPIMFMQYPFVRYAFRPIVRVAQNRYLYTGITYHEKDLTLIESVDEQSPAFQAGIRKGDRIVQINRMNTGSFDQMTSLYLAFVRDSYKYRNFHYPLRLRNAQSVSYFWNEYSNRSIRRMMRTPGYQSAMSYLFGFRPYVSSKKELSNAGKVTFQIIRDQGLFEVEVWPELKENSYITLE